MKHENYNVTRVDFKRYPDTGVELVPMPVVANASYNYKFGNKELQEELGLNMYDYGARNYDAAIGRTTTYDPLGEKFYSLSPQSFLNNNPLYFVDPTGMQSEGWIKQVIDGKTTMTYDPNVNTVDEANIANYKGVESVGPTGVTVSKGVTYNLNVDGSVTTNGAGIQAHEIGTNGPTFTTPGGTQISSSKMDYAFRPSDASGAITVDNTIFNFWSGNIAAKGIIGALGSRITTADGFLFVSIKAKTPFNIPVQRFGNMSYSRPDFWGLRVGTNSFVNRTFVAIKPEWNSLTQFTSGVIPKGTSVQFGIVGPQGLAYPGGSLQFIVNSNSVINQSSKIILK